MKIKHLVLIIAFLIQSQNSIAQKTDNYNWWNPVSHEFPVVDGQGWPDQLKSGYQRLPKKAKKNVREAVWRLSKHSAGLLIRFRSDAKEIKIRYQANGKYAMPHMPATGVSGVDMYTKNSDGEFLWCRGNFSFKDTIQYHYSNLNPKDRYHDKGREYQLFLPLYNSIKWLEIGVQNGIAIEPLNIRKEKPIVVYGTSIAHGACASRPGMAWTSILARKLDRPLINLGFSGNGKLEKEMIDQIKTIDAKIFILDCLPNLTPNKDRTLEDVNKLIIASVQGLRKTHPKTPILLVDHAGYSDGLTNEERLTIYSDLNKTNHKAFNQLKSKGDNNLYLISNSEFNLGMEDYVDGTHPSDLGMKQYAQAYEEKIRTIINEPLGKISTTIPVTQSREPVNYNWEKRHQELLKLNKKNPAEICFVGNSITHFWGGFPKGPVAKGSKSWNKYLKPLHVRNFGFGWDRVENVLWRVYHDEFDGYEANQVLINIGTNNLLLNTNEEIVSGLENLIQAIQFRQPKAKILLLAIYPRREKENEVANLNLMISKMADRLEIKFKDVGNLLLNKDGKINEPLFSDGLHPNNKGYNKIAPEIKKYLQNEK